MPTMRDEMHNYGGVQDYGYETDPWPVDWDSIVRQERPVDGYRNGWGLIPENASPSDPSVDDVEPLHLLRYDTYETGVGCADHGDPECLCDVHVTEPVQVACSTGDYEWADLSRLRHGTVDWWRSILGVHDAMHVLTTLATDSDGKVGRFKGRFTDGTDVVRYALDLSNMEGLTHGQVAEIHNVGYGSVQHARRRLQGKVESKKGKVGK